MIRRLVALLYALEGKPIDTAAIMSCYALMKESTGVFSAFRGISSTCIAAMLSLKGDQKRLFDRTVAVYEIMKEAKFRRSEFLVVAAYLVAANADQEDHRQVIDRMKTFYDGMKAQSWLYTGVDDYILAAMFALSGADVRSSIEDVGRLYPQLRSGPFASNSALVLAQILVIGGRSDHATADRIFDLRSAFKSQKIQADKAYTFPMLGILALLPTEVNTIVGETKEAMAYLRTQKGFGALSIQKQELLLYAGAITVSGYSNDVKDGLVTASVSTSITSIINSIIARQISMIIVAAAAGAAAAASAR
jgi:hypothetical protein